MVFSIKFMEAGVLVNRHKVDRPRSTDHSQSSFDINPDLFIICHGFWLSSVVGGPWTKLFLKKSNSIILF
jgi:hypothetical protein